MVAEQLRLGLNVLHNLLLEVVFLEFLIYDRLFFFQQFQLFVHIVQFFFCDLIGRALTHGLEDGYDIQLPLGQAPRKNRATVNEDCCAVHANDRHNASRHVFVATTDGHKSVEALAAHDRFDRVRNNLARDK